MNKNVECGMTVRADFGLFTNSSNFWSLDIGICDLFEIWCLGFGILFVGHPAILHPICWNNFKTVHYSIEKSGWFDPAFPIGDLRVNTPGYKGRKRIQEHINERRMTKIRRKYGNGQQER